DHLLWTPVHPSAPVDRLTNTCSKVWDARADTLTACRGSPERCDLPSPPPPPPLLGTRSQLAPRGRRASYSRDVTVQRACVRRRPAQGGAPRCCDPSARG